MTTQVVLPLAALVVGAILAWTGQWLSDRRQSRRAERQWSAAFQRDALVDVQQAINDIEQTLGDTIVSKVTESGGSWPVLQPDDPDIVKAAAARRQMRLSVSRISDEDLRSSIDAYLDIVRTLLTTGQVDPDVGELRKVGERRAELYEDILNTTGSLLRSSTF